MKTDYAACASAYGRHRTPHPDVVARLVKVLTPSSDVLEVGCGTGNYISAVAQAVGCSCTGVDPEPAMLAQLQSRGSRVHSHPGVAESLGFPDRSFDLVFTVDVIHHVVDRPASFREAFRVLRPGGRICTTTDSEWVIRNRRPLSLYFPETVEFELRRYPAMADLHRFMADAGFVDVREELVERSFYFTDPSPIRAKVFSSLVHLEQGAFERGLARLEADLARGPVQCIWRYVLLWGVKPELSEV